MKKCLICGEKFAQNADLFDHYKEDHGSEFDPDWDGAKCSFFKRYGRVTGTCRQCHKETSWNDSTSRPNVFCNDMKCRKEFRASFLKNMKSAGKDKQMEDPEFQKKMLFNRKIAGKYRWSDGEVKQYVGSYELDFLKFLDHFMKFESKDVMVPAPQIIKYVHEGKERFYIPDVYIASLNLVVEIKDGGSNPNTHPKIMAVDKVKEKLKDEAILKTGVNYIKVVDKKYFNFVEYLNNMKAKESIDNGSTNGDRVGLSEQHSCSSNSNGNTDLYHVCLFMASEEVDAMNPRDYVVCNDVAYRMLPCDPNDGKEIEKFSITEYGNIKGSVFSIGCYRMDRYLAAIDKAMRDTEDGDNHTFLAKVYSELTWDNTSDNLYEVVRMLECIGDVQSYALNDMANKMDQGLLESHIDAFTNGFFKTTKTLNESLSTDTNIQLFRESQELPKVTQYGSPTYTKYKRMVENVTNKDTMIILENIITADGLLTRDQKVELLNLNKIKYNNGDNYNLMSDMDINVLPYKLAQSYNGLSVLNDTKVFESVEKMISEGDFRDYMQAVRKGSDFEKDQTNESISESVRALFNVIF